jgi:carbonic anhydrase
MPDIAAGVVKFQKEVFPEKKDLFKSLALGQNPDTLFITCSDSRIDPCLMTQTEPGELFICRNAGNIVPPHTGHTGGMTASIEYAVAALKVKHIVVCGHSSCGAMTAAMNHPHGLEELPHVKEWLGYAKAAAQIVKERTKDSGLDDVAKIDLLIKENVLLQMQHLRTHPYVATGLAMGHLDLHGWVYDIRTGAVDAYDDDKKTFLPVEERYAKEVAAFLAEQKVAACS